MALQTLKIVADLVSKVPPTLAKQQTITADLLMYHCREFSHRIVVKLDYAKDMFSVVLPISPVGQNGKDIEEEREVLF